MRSWPFRSLHERNARSRRLRFGELEARAVVAVLPPPGPISWYRVEANGHDFVGSSNGTLVGGAGFAGGNVGQAFSLDGKNDPIEMNPSASLDVGTSDGLT